MQDEVMESLLLTLNKKDVEQFAKLQDGFLKGYSLIAPHFVRYF